MNDNTTPPPVPPAPEPWSPPADPGFRDLFDALLRRPRELAAAGVLDRGSTLIRFAGIALGSLTVFGFVLGTFAWQDQIWAAPLKLGSGLLFAGIICFPSLYIFSGLAGSAARAGRLAAILTGMLALTGILLLGFAPAVWIFTQGTTSFGFMGALAIASWLVACVFGIRFLALALRVQGATHRGPLLIWSVIFLLVTLQLTTSLRPILGTSERFVTPEKKFFLQHWGESAGKSLGAQNAPESGPSDPPQPPSR